MHFTEIHMIKKIAGTKKKVFCFIIIPSPFRRPSSTGFGLSVHIPPQLRYLKFRLFLNRGLSYRNCINSAFGVLVEVTVEITVSLIEVCGGFGENFCLHFQCRRLRQHVVPKRV